MESTDSEECTQKNELVDVQVDSHRLHIKIQELNVFLTGLERRYGMLKPVSEDTNILEQQFVEYQVHYDEENIHGKHKLSYLFFRLSTVKFTIMPQNSMN